MRSTEMLMEEISSTSMTTDITRQIPMFRVIPDELVLKALMSICFFDWF